MILVFALQLALPLILITVIGVVPSRNALGFCVQVLATAAALLAVGLTGIWMLPPWWAPYAFGGLLLLAVALGARKRKPSGSALPAGIAGWTVAALYLVLGGAAVGQAASALSGRTPPPVGVADLTFPLGTGTYLVVNGGSTPSINAHVRTLDPSVPRFHAWRGQSYGVDIVEVDGLGLRVDGLQPPDPSRYRIYGADVRAPCAGRVVYATDGVPDMGVPVTDRAHMAGNHLVLRCGAADVLLGHLRPGSLRVAVGARVAVGDRLAAVGNSGNTDEPHLHIHAQRPGTAEEPASGDPLSVRFGGRFLVRNDRVSVR